MNIELLLQVAQILAFSSAAVFFIYKVFTGYFVPNMSLDPEITRRTDEETGNDMLIVKVSLSKGDKGSINIHDAKVRFTGDFGQRIVDLIGINRLSFDSTEINNKDKKLIAWDRISRKKPFLRIGPQESTVFSCVCEVSKNATTLVEVVILGKKPNSWLKSQWRASLVSA